jgi:hypothetical protein
LRAAAFRLACERDEEPLRDRVDELDRDEVDRERDAVEPLLLDEEDFRIAGFLRRPLEPLFDVSAISVSSR